MPSPTSPPVITSFGGGDSANIAIPEGNQFPGSVYVEEAGFVSPMTYRILGGADAANFELYAYDPVADFWHHSWYNGPSAYGLTGSIQFVERPDFEIARDADHDNIYEVIVEATNSAGFSDRQTLFIKVTDVDDRPRLTGTDGADTFHSERQGYLGYVASGGRGNDIYWIDAENIEAVEKRGEGKDEMMSSLYSFKLFANIENGTVVGSDSLDITGNELANTLTGNYGNNHLTGAAGNDKLIGGWGDDVLDGGAGKDKLVGGPGNDILIGGANADVFRFEQDCVSYGVVETDRILDFSRIDGDKIDLRAIDAKMPLGNQIQPAGNQAFTFVGLSAVFSGQAGELHYSHVGNDTLISGDVNADGHADFNILITGSIDFLASDFLL